MGEASAQVEKEEKVGCDSEAPLAMMGGMGGEELCNLTFLDEGSSEKARNKEASAQVEKEEKVGCDSEAPLAMMGGMGGEELCNLTFLDEAVLRRPGTRKPAPKLKKKKLGVISKVRWP